MLRRYGKLVGAVMAPAVMRCSSGPSGFIMRDWNEDMGSRIFTFNGAATLNPVAVCHVDGASPLPSSCLARNP